jgi:hypothetical protein
MLRYVILFLTCMVSPVSGVNGVDMSTLVTKSSFECLKRNGINFAIIRCYMKSDIPDPNCPVTVANAWAAGIPCLFFSRCVSVC